MNVHLSYDDKFLDYFIANERKYTETVNKYIVFSDAEIKFTRSDNVIVLNTKEDGLTEAKKILRGAVRVFFHSMSFLFANLIVENKLYEKSKLIWIFFGAEVFTLSFYIEKFLLKESYRFYINNTDFKFHFTLNPVKLRRNLINYRFYSDKKHREETRIIEAMGKIDYFAHYIEQDYEDFIMPLFPKMKFTDWNYIGLDQMNLTSTEVCKQAGNKILCGNSASLFNNHLDALKFLYSRSEKDAGHKTLIMPLSYGGSDKYVSEVKTLGGRLFGKDIVCLEGFLSKDDYFNLLAECEAALFFNIRSQAAGNIVWFLKNDIPVFMLPESNLYKFLNLNNVKVYSIDDLNDKLEIVENNTTVKQLNMVNLEKLFGEKEMEKKYLNLLTI